jgi:hypothetical protein
MLLEIDWRNQKEEERNGTREKDRRLFFKILKENGLR